MAQRFNKPVILYQTRSCELYPNFCAVAGIPVQLAETGPKTRLICQKTTVSIEFI